MAARSKTVLRLYRSLLREGKKFQNYNFRSYAVRRIRDAFRENKNETNEQKIEEMIKFGTENLDVVKRQVVIGNLYSAPELIIEKNKPTPAA